MNPAQPIISLDEHGLMLLDDSLFIYLFIMARKVIFIIIALLKTQRDIKHKLV